MRRLVKKILHYFGRCLAYLYPRNAGGFFFFFPFYHVGGGEKVHADILALASDKRPWIIINLRSCSSAHREAFAASGKLIDLSVLLQYRVAKNVLIGFFSNSINRSEKAVLFASNSSFFYDLLPYVKNNAYVIDLIHAYGGGIEHYSLPHVARIDRRVVINRKTYKDLKEQYAMHGLNSDLIKKVDVVENKVTMPTYKPAKLNSGRIKIIYVGRGTDEKRVHLVGRIGRICHERKLPIDLVLVGNVGNAVDPGDRTFCQIKGELYDQAKIENLYKESDLLLITSSREGFPLVIMEAMAYGVVPLTTDVGGIPYHIKNSENGFLIAGSDNEARVVASFIEVITQLCENRSQLKDLQERAYKYAARNFTGERFDAYYSELFNRV